MLRKSLANSQFLLSYLPRLSHCLSCRSVMRWSRPLLLWWFVAGVGIFAQDIDDGPIYFPDDDILQNTQQRIPTSQTSERPRNTPQITQRPLPLPQTTHRPLVSTGKSLQMCRKYAESVYYKVPDLTGTIIPPIDTCMLIEPLIVNGTVAQAREFPHMALIGFESRFGGIQWKCGGSLISKRFVLSAAHCNRLNPKRVRLGDYNIYSTKDDDDNNARSEEFDIIKVVVHPEYNETKSYNDITLYELDKDVVFNEYIRPICLHTEHNLPRGFGIISGWGSTEFAGPQSSILLKGNVSFVSAEECGKMLNPSLETAQSEIRDEMMICAGNFVNGTDTCQGDSGGPLQYRLKDPYCMYSQVGITSFGVRCGYDEGQPKYPGVYTRVSNYVPWIESIVWP